MFKFKTFILYLVSLIFFGNQVFANQIFTFNNQVGPIKNGRSGEIRTPDPLVPNQMRYQAALRPELQNLYVINFQKQVNV